MDTNVNGYEEAVRLLRAKEPNRQRGLGVVGVIYADYYHDDFLLPDRELIVNNPPKPGGKVFHILRELARRDATGQWWRDHIRFCCTPVNDGVLELIRSFSKESSGTDSHFAERLADRVEKDGFPLKGSQRPTTHIFGKGGFPNAMLTLSGISDKEARHVNVIASCLDCLQEGDILLMTAYHKLNLGASFVELIRDLKKKRILVYLIPGRLPSGTQDNWPPEVLESVVALRDVLADLAILDVGHDELVQVYYQDQWSSIDEIYRSAKAKPLITIASRGGRDYRICVRDGSWPSKEKEAGVRVTEENGRRLSAQILEGLLENEKIPEAPFQSPSSEVAPIGPGQIVYHKRLSKDMASAIERVTALAIWAQEYLRRPVPGKLRRPFCIHLVGPTGSGKELFARLFAEKVTGEMPLTVSCGVLDAEKARAELFGCWPGAYTHAPHEGASGWFENADGSVIFLDELDKLPKPVQPILLRLLEQGELQRMGPFPGKDRLVGPDKKGPDKKKPAKDSIRTRVAFDNKGNAVLNLVIVFASERSVEELEEAELLIPSLAGRLGDGIPIPPLDERPSEDILLLADYLWNQGWSPETLPLPELPEAAKRLLAQSGWHWPKGVRDLQSILTGAAVSLDILRSKKNLTSEQVEKELVRLVQEQLSGRMRARPNPKPLRSRKEEFERMAEESRLPLEWVEKATKSITSPKWEIKGGSFRPPDKTRNGAFEVLCELLRSGWQTQAQLRCHVQKTIGLAPNTTSQTILYHLRTTEVVAYDDDSKQYKINDQPLNPS